MEIGQWRRHRIRLRFGLPSYRSTPSDPVKTLGCLEVRSVRRLSICVWAATAGLLVAFPLATLVESIRLTNRTVRPPACFGRPKTRRGESSDLIDREIRQDRAKIIANRDCRRSIWRLADLRERRDRSGFSAAVLARSAHGVGGIYVDDVTDRGLFLHLQNNFRGRKLLYLLKPSSRIWISSPPCGCTWS
jgi:hypothetical protein